MERFSLIGKLTHYLLVRQIEYAGGGVFFDFLGWVS
jgi:hypothetical protein